MNDEIIAIIGPLVSSATIGAQFACSTLNIPQIAPIASDPTLANNLSYNYLLRMMPVSTVESSAIASFIEYYGWTKVAMLASNTDFGMICTSIIIIRLRISILSKMKLNISLALQKINFSKHL